MNFFQRARRNQRAVNRARNIHRFRKGRPKLGCYKCWYDCYEIEGDRCPECNTPIDRDGPWWRDGRWSIVAPTLVGMASPLVSFSGAAYLFGAEKRSYIATTAAWVMLIAGGMLLLPIASFFARYRTRSIANLKARSQFVSAPYVLFIALAPVLYAILALLETF